MGVRIGFNGNAVTTGTWASGSKIITPAALTNIAVGQIITGTGIPADTLVTEVLASTIKISKDTTAAGAATAISFADHPKIVDGASLVFDQGAYGSAWAGFTAPTPANALAEMRVVYNTDAAAARLYIYDGRAAAWRYVALS